MNERGPAVAGVLPRRKYSVRPARSLDDRDHAILDLLMRGDNQKEIAVKLGYSSCAIHMACSRMWKRWAVRTNEQLIAVLFREQILE